MLQKFSLLISIDSNNFDKKSSELIQKFLSINLKQQIMLKNYGQQFLTQVELRGLEIKGENCVANVDNKMF